TGTTEHYCPPPRSHSSREGATGKSEAAEANRQRRVRRPSDAQGTKVRAGTILREMAPHNHLDNAQFRWGCIRLETMVLLRELTPWRQREQRNGHTSSAGRVSNGALRSEPPRHHG